mmetsp:Transcript_9453/g.11293  ORF Transcript_9453/g.11293 Transcript_9453/m.11293 type:complete len:83 (+) Transcript_9453:401-649(+)
MGTLCLSFTCLYCFASTKCESLPEIYNREGISKNRKKYLDFYLYTIALVDFTFPQKIIFLKKNIYRKNIYRVERGTRVLLNK